jgi:hypothetical protein
MKLQTFIIAVLLTAASVVTAQAQPRHIDRDGQYFFCPSPDYDPYCGEPNDYSAALHPAPSQWRPPEYRPGPPVLMPAQGRFEPDLGAAAERAIRNALRPRYRKPPELPQLAPNLPPAAPPPAMSMEEEREYIIRQGEEHCRKFPQDTEVCHPPKPQ